jgi:hypothetical protein
VFVAPRAVTPFRQELVPEQVRLQVVPPHWMPPVQAVLPHWIVQVPVTSRQSIDEPHPPAGQVIEQDIPDGHLIGPVHGLHPDPQLKVQTPFRQAPPAARQLLQAFVSLTPVTQTAPPPPPRPPAPAEPAPAEPPAPAIVAPPSPPDPPAPSPAAPAVPAAVPAAPVVPASPLVPPAAFAVPPVPPADAVPPPSPARPAAAPTPPVPGSPAPASPAGAEPPPWASQPSPALSTEQLPPIPKATTSAATDIVRATGAIHRREGTAGSRQSITTATLTHWGTWLPFGAAWFGFWAGSHTGE